jgi:hypothetical protein
VTEMCGCPGIVGLHERDEWCPREFPLGGFCSCGQPYGSLHSCPERTRAVTPADQALETLALIAEHRLTVIPFGSDWAAADTRNGALATFAGASGGTIEMLHYDHLGEGPTIGDAVRACVARIKSNQ